MRSFATAVFLLLLAESAVAAVYLKGDRQPKEAGGFSNQTAVKQRAKTGDWYLAVDLVGSVSSSTFSCLKSYGVAIVFTRIYGPSNGGGQTDTTGVQNAITAYNSGMTVEVFIEPAPSSSKSGGQQFNEALNYATSQGLRIERVWLIVHWPIDWSSSSYSNVNFIQSVMSAANNADVQIGIYTNWYDWDQITGSSTSLPARVPLWYWNANGLGPKCASDADFSDFFPFGNFRSATVKQYGLGEMICSTILNVNAHSGNGLTATNSVDAEVVARAQMKQ
ncbi:Glycoside hydrolase, superfamily domain-containing protein [Aphelenchoides fujianensis]|nr:Glycoside hydrolase, superfamily domain-containing protein [Aphelenchoides fujianensis]